MADQWGPWMRLERNGCLQAMAGDFMQWSAVKASKGFGNGECVIRSGDLSDARKSATYMRPDIDWIDYRIRKPCGLVILQDLLKDLPHPTPEDAST